MPDADALTIPPAAAMLLDTSAHRLSERFAAVFSPETVRECLDDSYLVLAATARVQTHLYVLAERFAAALLAHHAAGRVTVRSAGSAPADSINPTVVAALAKIGLDLTQEFPKPLTDEAVRASDVVIIMGCDDACPIFPGKRYLNWDLDDPAGADLDFARALRDDIDARVRALLTELLDQS